jgi:hypothetical protein
MVIGLNWIGGFMLLIVQSKEKCKERVERFQKWVCGINV